MHFDNGSPIGPEDNEHATGLRDCQKSTVTTTSTADHGQESFDTYRHKLLATISAKFDLKSEQPIIYRMKGGSYNRICGVTVKIAGENHDYVYRTPRSLGPVEKSARMLRYLERQQAVPTPRIIAEQMDSSRELRNDTINDTSAVSVEGQAAEAYIIMEKLPGTPLAVVYNGFTFTQKVNMAVQLANLMVDIFNIPVPATIGSLRVDDQGKLLVTEFIHNQLLPEETEETYLRPAEVDLGNGPDILSSFKNLFDYMKRAKRLEDPQYTCNIRIYRKLVTAVDLLLSPLQQQSFDLNHCVFVHGDLAGRNIMVTPPKEEDGIYSISGVLDWDDCLALPPLAAYWSPSWLWEEYDTGPTESFRLGAEFDADPDEIPQSPEGQAIRQAFIEAIEARIPNYMSIVRIGHKAKIKQMLYVAQHGIFNPLVDDIVDDVYRSAGIPTLFGNSELSISGSVNDGTAPKTADNGIPSTEFGYLLPYDPVPAPVSLPVSSDSSIQDVTSTNTEALRVTHIASAAPEDDAFHNKEEQDFAYTKESCPVPGALRAGTDNNETESLELPKCFAKIGQWLTRRRAVRKEKLAKRRQKIVGAIKCVSLALTGFTP